MGNCGGKPIAKETIDEIPETTLASIAATAAGTTDIDSFDYNNGSIEYICYRKQSPNWNKALIIYRQSNENNTLCQKYINSSKVCIQ